MSKSESQKARAKLYRSKSFRRELAGDFGIGPMKDLAVSCLDALLETRRLPSRGETNAGAAAIDAALIMIAIGTMQTNQKAMLSLTDRLSAMELSKVIDIGGSPKRELSVAAASNLISDLTNAFEEHWAAPDSAFLEGLGHIVFITNIGDAPAGDAATILRVSDNRQYSYSTVTPPAVEEEFRRTMRGGMSFMPAAFAISPTISGTTSTAPRPRSGCRVCPWEEPPTGSRGRSRTKWGQQ